MFMTVKNGIKTIKNDFFISKSRLKQSYSKVSLTLEKRSSKNIEKRDGLPL